MLLSLAALAAFADEPAVTTSSSDDGSVVARCHIEASPAEVKEILADPVAASRLTAEIITVESKPKGDCVELNISTAGMWNPLRYKANRCPTKDGWRYDLAESEDFSALHSEWKLTPSGAGTDVEYRVRTEIKSIPSALVRKGTERSMRATLIRLAAKVIGR